MKITVTRTVGRACPKNSQTIWYAWRNPRPVLLPTPGIQRVALIEAVTGRVEIVACPMAGCSGT